MTLFDLFALHGPVLILHLYVLATVAVIAGFLARNEPLKTFSRWFLGATLAAHALVLTALAAHCDGGISRNVYLQLFAAGMLAFGLAGWVWRRFMALAVVTTPLALLLCLMSLFVEGLTPSVPQGFSGMFSVLHMGALFVSFGLLTLGFCAGSLFLVQERRLKAKSKLTSFQKDVPSLHTLDNLNAWATLIGFPLFSIGLLCGIVGARMAWGALLSGDAKELVSLAVWLLFAWLFHQRLACGWKGHKPAVLMVWLFVLCVFSLTVVNLFLTSSHRF